jgi:alpha-glucosidase
MHDVEIPPELVEDPQGRAQPARNRDVARTPMQWNSNPNAGFTSGTPYFPVADDYSQINVASQQEDSQSLLALYSRLIALRKDEAALRDGLQTHIRRQAALLFFRREHEGHRLLVALNMSSDGHLFTFSELAAKARVLLSTSMDRQGESYEHTVHLRGDEGLILVLE